jgi:hypothetical protein
MRASTLLAVALPVGVALAACARAPHRAASDPDAINGAVPAFDRHAVDAIDGVLAAFDHHDIVAIDEPHHDVATHAFLRALVRDPRFAARVDDIVVEFGNARHQPTLDRYLAGDDVPETELRQVWRDTTQILAWDAPVYRELLDTIRDVNRAAPSGRRLRVLAGDPPIDWSRVRSGADYEPFAAREPDYARVIRDQVLARHHKTLLVIGGAHITHRDPLAAARGKPGSPSITQLLEQTAPGSVFAVWTLVGTTPATALVRSLPPRSLLAVTGTPLGRRSFGEVTSGDVTILVKENGRSVPRRVTPTDYPPIETVVDALLWLGPSSTLSAAPPGTYDPAYVETLRFRAGILKAVYGVDFSDAIDDAISAGSASHR